MTITQTIDLGFVISKGFEFENTLKAMGLILTLVLI